MPQLPYLFARDCYDVRDYLLHIHFGLVSIHSQGTLPTNLPGSPVSGQKHLIMQVVSRQDGFREGATQGVKRRGETPLRKTHPIIRLESRDVPEECLYHANTSIDHGASRLHVA